MMKFGPALITRHTQPTVEVRPLRGAWLVSARVVWLAVAIVSVAMFVASLPSFYAQLLTFTAPHMPASAAIRAGLNQLGIPIIVFAVTKIAVLVALMVVFVGTGTLIFWRKSNDPVALFFSLTLVTFGAIWPNTLDSLVRVYPALDWLNKGLNTFGFLGFFLLLYVFPDGRFVPRWTRWVALVFVVGLSLDTFVPDSSVNIENWPAPFNLLSAAEPIVFFGTMIYAQTYRYRCVSTQLQRQQTKWVMASLVTAVICFAITGWLDELPVFNRPGAPAALFAFATGITYGLVFMLVPIAVGIAVLRYRLWDIDPIINRTIIYALLTASVVGIYVLIVGYLSTVFRTESNLLISLVATGVVAVGFQPLRERLQRGINRLMYGQRDEPYAVIARLGERLEGTIAPDAVLPTIVQTVKEALKLPYVAIELKQHERFVIVAAEGQPSAEPLQLPLIYQHETVGALVLAPRAAGEPWSPADRRLLDDLARQAGIAVHAVRLTAELQRARQHIVTAREEERRRLRRDLHDGIGPQLASQTLTIDAAIKLLPRDPQAVADLLTELKAQSQTAIADIRRVVYDLRPPALDDLGLLNALREYAAHYAAADLHISIEAPEQLPALPAAVEVAVYRIIQEALTNVVRHAQASRCTVRLHIDEAVHIDIWDDGRGLPAIRRAGVGLTSMRERAAELGGSCVIETRAQGGTEVRARLPLPIQE